jgi:hypothetical protein
MLTPEHARTAETSAADVAALPTYAELLARQDGPPGSSWGVFGADDQLGTLNLLGEQEARSAAALVRRGTTFSLDYEVNAFSRSPPTGGQHSTRCSPATTGACATTGSTTSTSR